MNDSSQSITTNYLKGHFIALFLDLFALGSYFGFNALSDVSFAIDNSQPEIVVNEGLFYTFILLYILILHFLLIIFAHTPISRKSYKEKFLIISFIITFIPTTLSGFITSNYVESSLLKKEYHFCENLSHEGRYFSTHHVWRAKNQNCN